MAAQALVSSSVVAGVTGVFSGAHSASSYSGDGSALTGVGSAAAAALTIAGKAAEAGISKGMCLYISGATGQTPSLSLADNTIDAKDEILGLAAEDIANNNNGLVRIAGLLTGVDTDGTGVPGSSESWNDGDELFCSTSGLLTKVEPTAGTVRHIGYVAYAHGTNGKIIVATHQEHFMGAPAGADMSLRMGDSAGATKISFKDYSNAEVASVNSDGVFTGTEFVGPLTGTADQAVLASQATQLAATTPCQEPGFISRGMTVAGLDICVEVLDAEVDGSSLPVSGKALFDHDATADAHHAKAVSGDITHDSTVGGIAAAAHHAKAVSGDITHDSTIGGTTDDAHFDHADDLAELNAQTGASLADGPHVDLSGEVNIAPGTSFTSTFTSTGNLELGGGELSGSAGELTFNGIVHETTNPAVLVKTNTAQLMPTGGWQNIFFDEAEYEYTDMWSVSVSSDRVTIPAKGDGLYDTKCATEWAGNSTSYRITQIIKNGSRMEFKQENISESSAFKQEVSRRMELVAGDYISCLVVQATGGNLGVHATTAGQFSYLEVIKVR